MKLTHKLLPIGFTFHWCRKKYHVVSVFRDNDVDDLLYVLKRWNRYSQSWVYEVWSAWEYDWNFRKEELIKQIDK